MQHVDQVVQVPKSNIAKLVLEHVKKTLSPDDPNTRPKTRNKIQDIRRETTYADPIHRPPPTPMGIPTQIIPRKAIHLDNYSLEQDINIDFEENFKKKKSRRYVFWNMPKTSS